MVGLKRKVEDLLINYGKNSRPKAEDMQLAGRLLASVTRGEIKDAHLQTAVRLGTQPDKLLGFLKEVVAKQDARSTEEAEGSGPDASADHMMEMVANMPPVALPRTTAEFEELINGTAGLRIPIPSKSHTDLAAQLTGPFRATLRSVPYSYAASALHHVIRKQPTDVGSEQTTTCCMFDLLDTINRQLSVVWSGVEGFKLQLNRTEKQAGSTSAATPDRMRPDTLIIHSNCTMLLGQDKAPTQLKEALEDLDVYAKGGLKPCHYGNICGLPAYVASGFLVQFCFITQGGHVEPAGPVLDLATMAGRLCAVICVINLYRLLQAMTKALPPLPSRRPLWCPFFHGSAEITLTPLGATKKIKGFKAHLQAAGTTKKALKRAYKAAATAAAQQQQQGQLPFLVWAQDEDGQPAVPTFEACAGYTVHTTPLGYIRHIRTEEDVQHVALACCKAARVLHEAGVVHSDFRLPNVVWLTDSHCMVIDLEHTRLADKPVDKPLKDWVDATYDMVENARCYTRRSDMHQIGRLVQQVLPVNHSAAAAGFVRALLDKSLTAEAALQHPWQQQQQQPP